MGEVGEAAAEAVGSECFVQHRHNAVTLHTPVALSDVNIAKPVATQPHSLLKTTLLYVHVVGILQVPSHKTTGEHVTLSMPQTLAGRQLTPLAL